MPLPPDLPFDDTLLERLLPDSVAVALRGESPAAFFAWMRARIRDELAPPLDLFSSQDPSDAVDESVLDVFAWQLGRAIWNGLPLPGNNFRPRPLPNPGRNDPCPCGSGAKFKQCCGRLPAMPSLDPAALWPIVLEQLDRGVLKAALERGQIPLEGLLAHAQELHEQGRSKKAVELLAPQFAGALARTDELAEAALDLLCNLYDELGHQRKKVALLNDLVARVRRSSLRSGAWQRLAAIRMDEGDSAGSWEAFHRAQQDAPDSPGVALLEVHLLVGEHRHREASERAAFWARRLRKRHAEGLEELLSHLDAVAADPAGAFAQMATKMLGGASERLQTWLAAVRDRPLPVYALTDEAAPVEDAQALRDSLRQRLRGMGVGGDQLDEMLDQALSAFEEGQSLPEDALDEEEDFDLADDEPPSDCITAPESVRALEDEWHGVFPLEKPFSVNDTPFGATDPWEPGTEALWGTWLEAHPAAFDSLDILDDIATALHLHPQFGAGWLDDVLLGPVLSRAATIVDQAIAARPEPRLEWSWTGNRPALRSLVRLGWLHQRAGRHEQDFALAERLVALNPLDNHGLRIELMRGYLATGRDEAAVALAAKFPDDSLVDITYGRALALFRLGRSDEATAALREALEQSPKVGKFLLAEKRRKPRIDPHGVRIGGDDEAWLYREAMRGAWQATPGAMAWLGEVARGRR